MKTNEIMNGFEIIDIKQEKELNGRAVQMKHIKSGARLLWFDRPDVNKTFSITFRTVPSDDTGIFHILEHSVLCGSEKYPLKEPFVELIKNSMNTFLNALTFSDKTMYPISSKNDKDFFNLVDVYLDAVFNPLIYKKPEIFYQEGWHYEIGKNDAVSYKGVVFNEMKGVYADSESVKESAVLAGLFPDSCYSFESGGHPAHIPDLTYEQFVDGHRRFYHPSNSYIILDGDLDIEKVTAHIDSNYLCKYESIEPCPMPEMQKPVKSEMNEVYFEQSKDMPLENRSSLELGFVIGKFDEKEKIYAARILSDILCDNNQSYLTSALLSKGLAEDVSIHIIDGILQPCGVIDIKNIKDGSASQVRKTVMELLSELCEKGIDRSELEAAVSNFEFQLKEKDFGFPRGLYNAMCAMETWLYDGNPLDNIITGSIFDDLREKADNGYFEDLIKELFIDNAHSCSVLAKPSYTAGEQAVKKENDRINAVTSSWNDAQRQYYLDEQKRLDEWQSSVDTPEALAKIPTITLDDISIEPEELPTQIEGNILKHNVQTDGIVYVNMYFDVTSIEEEKLSEMRLLCSLLGEVATENYSAKELKTQLLTKCGSYSVSLLPFAKLGKMNEGTIKIKVSFSALERYVSDAAELIREMITSSKFDDKSCIIDIIRQIKQATYQSYVTSGSTHAMRRASAYFGYEGVVGERTGGIEYYQWLKLQENEPSVISRLSSLLKSAFCKDNVIISVTNDNAEKYVDLAKKIVDGLADSQYTDELKIKPWKKSNDGIIIPGDISFSGMCGDLGLYDGKALLMSHIISLDYLWNEVRVKGGAYGTGLRNSTNGSVSAYSYRDPDSSTSLSVYLKSGEYLRSLVKSQKSLLGFIIGAFSSVSPLLTPSLTGFSADVNYIKGVSEDFRREFRRQLVGTTLQDLNELSYRLDDALSNGCFCIVGSQGQIDKARLDNIYSL